MATEEADGEGVERRVRCVARASEPYSRPSENMPGTHSGLWYLPSSCFSSGSPRKESNPQ